ncbi:hypothetical protein [Luteolibacter marinus]|uniref:hypothetical protein n=1 Tax=Luteolibacter marinus TaxID=2776705 RepID=UPI001867D529|nr:hypothetical protein [Luteolibacter marinus]
MNQLYSFLSRVERGRLKVAPWTSKSTWPEGRSPYKVIMISAFIRGIHAAKAFKNGLVTPAEITPFFKEVAEIVMPESEVSDGMIVQPFWRLGAGQPKIWNLIPAEGAGDVLIAAILDRRNVRTLPELSRFVCCAELSTPDYELLSDPLGARAVARFLAGEYLDDHDLSREYLRLVAP